ncbi:MAG: adenylate kinase [Cyclobacteriaceae bacterium]
MLNIVLFGPPGAGKGTQSEKLITTKSLVHLSTGDLFRKHLNEGTDLGKKAQGFMDEGRLVPDEIVIGMVEDTIANNTDANGFIFDGFPRTVAQAQALDLMLKNHELDISGMISLEVPEQELIARLLERGKTSGRVDDQNENKIAIRIEEYQNKTEPVAGYYKKQDKFNGIDGVGSIDQIFEKIDAVVSTF